MQWCGMYSFLFLKFQKFIKEIVRIDIVSFEKVKIIYTIMLCFYT